MAEISMLEIVYISLSVYVCVCVCFVPAVANCRASAISSDARPSRKKFSPDPAAIPEAALPARYALPNKIPWPEEFAGSGELWTNITSYFDVRV